MKKTIILSLVLASAQYCAFSQGYFNASSTTKLLLNNYTTPGTTAFASGVNVGFLFGPSGTPALGSSGSASGLNASYTLTQWSQIVSDPNYAIAVATSGGTTPYTIVSSSGISAGKFSGGTGQVFPINGASQTLSAAGGSTTVELIAWVGSYAAPTAIGFSAPFAYTYANNIGTPSQFDTAGLTSVYIDKIVATPEPSTMALAALSGASLLLFRRRK